MTNTANEAGKPRHLVRATQPSGVFREAITEHLALVVSGVLGLLIVVRLLAVSGWDPTTTQALYQAIGAADVALGVLLGVVPEYLALGLSALLGVVAYNYRRGFFGNLRWYLATLYAVAFIILLGTLFAMLMSVFYVLAGRLFRGVDEKSANPIHARSQSQRYLTAILFGSIVVPAVFSSTFWRPAEIVSLRNGSTITASVLSADADSYALLTRDDEPQRVMYVPSREVASREICAPEKRFVLLQRPKQLFGQSPDYPRCPS